MTLDWLAGVLPDNQVPGLRSLLTNMDLNMEIS